MTCLFLLLLSAEANFIDSVFLRQAEIGSRLKGVNYRSELTYIETDLLHNRAETISCVRRVIMDHYENQKDLFISARVNGRPVSSNELNRICQTLKRKGVFARQTRLPFFLENRHEYQYEAAGEIELNKRHYRRLRFVPKRPDQHHIIGTGYFDPFSYDLVRLEFVPARVPIVVDSMQLILSYDRFDEFWLPAKFTLKMDLSLKLVKLLMRRRIEIVDCYSDYYLKLAEPTEKDK